MTRARSVPLPLLATLLIIIIMAAGSPQPDASGKALGVDGERCPSPAVFWPPKSNTAQGEMGVAMVENGRARFADWRVGSGGDITQVSAFDDRECADHPPRPPLKIAFAPIAEPGTAKPPFLRGRLRLPGRKEVTARLTWRGCPGDLGSGGMLTPEAPREHWVLLLKESCESPAGEGWKGLAQGDLDGDGRDDVAFVGEGVGTCGGEPTPECEVFWLQILLTSTKTVWASEAAKTLIRIRNLPEIERRLGAPLEHKAVKWSGRVARGRYDVRLAGPSGELTWSAVLREARIVVSGGR